MKTLLTLITLAALPFLVVPAGAQIHKGPRQMEAEKPTWRDDPMHSIHTYKRPNKAAVVQRRSSGMGVTVNMASGGTNQVANYKMPVVRRVSGGKTTVPPTLDVAYWNPSIPRPQATTIDVRTDEPVRPTNSVVVGD